MGINMITFGFKDKFSGWVRAVAAIVLGVILVARPEGALVLVVRLLAAFLIASGVVSVIYGLVNRKNGGLSLLIFNAIVDVVLGAILFVYAAPVTSIIIILIGIALLCFGILQIITLGSVAPVLGTAFGFFILPALCVIGGSLLLFNPFGSKVTLTVVAGIVCIVYGVSEVVATLRMRKAMNTYQAKFEGTSSSPSEGASKPSMDVSGVKDVDYTKVDNQ